MDIMIQNREKTKFKDCQSFIDNLQFTHPISDRKLIETHISCVILTGKFAYKIKKAVDLGFVDYTTIDKRKRFCELEVEFNSRFAPDIYLGVVPIYKMGNGIRFGELGESSLPDAEIIDYAVKMKEFPQDAIVAARLSNPQLSPRTVEDFGSFLATIHCDSDPVEPALEIATSSQIRKDALDNFEALKDPLAEDWRFELLEKLEIWTEKQALHLESKFGRRRERGLVKRCHGDLHLKNVIQVAGRLIPFDGIEFNNQFQCIDVLNELAFPVMDFFARGRSDLGWRLLNAYLETTVDYSDLDVLRFYLVYRAMVRAKVAWLNPRNHSEARRLEYASDENLNEPFAGPWDKYLAVAAYFAFELKPKLSITHGFSGSGKSTIAMKAIDTNGGIRIRSDVLRQQLAEQTNTADKYSCEMSDRVYARLAELSRDGIASGFPIIADATFLRIKYRRPFVAVAELIQVPFEIIDCDAPFGELCRRLQDRHTDPSEADIAVLNLQMKNHDPLGVDEVKWVREAEESTFHSGRHPHFFLGQRRTRNGGSVATESERQLRR